MHVCMYVDVEHMSLRVLYEITKKTICKSICSNSVIHHLHEIYSHCIGLNVTFSGVLVRMFHLLLDSLCFYTHQWYKRMDDVTVGVSDARMFVCLTEFHCMKLYFPYLSSGCTSECQLTKYGGDWVCLLHLSTQIFCLILYVRHWMSVYTLRLIHTFGASVSK